MHFVEEIIDLTVEVIDLVSEGNKSIKFFLER